MQQRRSSWGGSRLRLLEHAPQRAIHAEISIGAPLTHVGNLALDLDPAFLDPDGPDNYPLTFSDNDYRLAAGSHAVDAGRVSAIFPDRNDVDGDGDVTDPTPVDLAHAVRRRDDPNALDVGDGQAPLVDMEALERAR